MRTSFPALLLVAALVLGGAAPPSAAAETDPVVDSVTPDRGLTAGGYDVTILGANFSSPLSVTFGGTASPTVTVVSPTEITVAVPPHVRGTVDVLVTIPAAPPAVSNPPGTFTYEEVPSRVWIPRASGSSTGGNPGGFDVTVVDIANRRVEASLDLNPADPLLPTDDDWVVAQVLFSTDGAYAFLATAGVPGTSDSRRLFVVKTARLFGTEAGEPVVASLDTGGNPYQLALSPDGKRLHAADAGSWKGSSTALPDGALLVYDLTDPAAPVAVGTPTTLGMLPVLHYDSTAYRKWGTNSSFTGTLQAKNSRTAVLNVLSHTVSTVDLSTRAVVDTGSVPVGDGGPFQVSTSIPSPYSDEFVFIETTDLITPGTQYWIHRSGTGDLLDKGAVSSPVRFFPGSPFPDLQNRSAWPHPDGASLVTLPAGGAKVVTWSPATGAVTGSVTVPGTAAPSGLALNDVSGLLYARRNTGGWTVLSVPSSRGGAPVVVAQMEDATGVDSLRVVGDGKMMAGTAASSFALIDAVPGSATAHQVVDTIDLPLNPDGGPLFPQPGGLLPLARTFVTVAPPGSGPKILLPLAGSVFCPAEDPASIEFAASGASGQDLELELGSQPDFFMAPGEARIRMRVPNGASSATPSAGQWRRVLRAAAGEFDNPLWARVNVVLFGGGRSYGETTSWAVCTPSSPEPEAPANGASVSAGSPPTFSFVPGEGGGRHWIEFARPGGFGEGVAGRFRVKDPDAAVPPRSLWRKVSRELLVRWRIRNRDLVRRVVHSEERTLVESE